MYVRAATLTSCILLLCASGVEAQQVSYSTWLLRDTVYVYEPVWMCARAQNMTGDDFPARPFVPTSDILRIEISDESGESVVGLRLAGTWVPTPDAFIAPFGLQEDCLSLLYYSAFSDSVSSYRYFPPGVYQIETRWHYDPWGRARVNDSPYLYDTVLLTVVMPTGDDSLAMEAYRAAGSAKANSRRQETEFLWQLAHDYPSSRFAAAALSTVALRIPSEVSSLISHTDVEIIRLLALTAPNHPSIARYIRGIARGRDGRNELNVTLLREISDAVPGTRAGDAAVRILRTEGVD